MNDEKSDENSSHAKNEPFIDYQNLKVFDDYSGSDAQNKRVSEEIRAIIDEVK
jgi:hypothetical protein